MTSRAGATTTKADPRRRPATGARGRTASLRAFTLLEIMLVLSLLALLAGATAVAFSGRQDRVAFDEAAFAFETALRRARVDACNDGVRVRLVFDEETGRVRVLREPDPLGEPGTFQEYSDCIWRDFLPTGRAKVTRSELTGDSAYRTLNMEEFTGGSSDAAPMETVTFYPDGTSDSARFELTPLAPDDDRKAVIELDGQHGLIRRHVLGPEQLEEYYETRDVSVDKE